MSIAGLAAGGVKRRIGASRALRRELLDDVVVCVRADDGAAIFAVLLAAWAAAHCAQAGGSEAVGLQGSACRDRSRCRRWPDRRLGGRGRARRDRPPAAGGRGSASATCPCAVEHGVAPRSRRSWRWWACRVAAVPFYLPLGSPWLRLIFRWPRARARRDANQPLENLVAQVEAHLEKNPTDAPRLERAGAGAGAARPLRRRGPGLSQRRSPMPATAPSAAPISAKPLRPRRAASSRRRPRPSSNARSRSMPTSVKASYFLGLAAEQDGRKADAAAIWRAMLAKAPAECAMAAAGAGSAGAGSAAPPRPRFPDDAMAAAKDMNEPDRDAMIRGMVDRLATRLKQNGDDVEGWLRLVRAYMVMGDRDKASERADRRAAGGRQRCRALAPAQ